MRAAIDTDVLLSGLLWHDAPHTVVEQVRAGTLALISSLELLADLAEVIARPKFAAILAHSATAGEDDPPGT